MTTLGEMEDLTKNSRNVRMLCTETTIGKFKNVKNGMKVLECIRCAEDVEGLNAVSILFQAPCRRVIDDCDAPEIIKINLIEGGVVEPYPKCSI